MGRRTPYDVLNILARRPVRWHCLFKGANFMTDIKHVHLVINLYGKKIWRIYHLASSSCATTSCHFWCYHLQQHPVEVTHVMPVGALAACDCLFLALWHATSSCNTLILQLPYVCGTYNSAADPDHYDTDPDFYFDTDPDPTCYFDTEPDQTIWHGSGSLWFQRGNVHKTVLLIHLNLIFLVCRSARSQIAGIRW
jgi:hypothetical protein